MAWTLGAFLDKEMTMRVRLFASMYYTEMVSGRALIFADGATHATVEANGLLWPE